MSMSTSYRTEIVIPQPQLQACAGNIKGSPCMEIMSLALEKIARERGGSVSEGYRDCTGTYHPCLMGIVTPAMPNGVGIEIDAGGKVSFPYDENGADKAEVRSLCDGICRAYATIAIMRVQSRHGYRVAIEGETSGPGGNRVTTIAIRT